MYKITDEERETRETYDTEAPGWDQVAHAHWIDEDWMDWANRLPENPLILDIGCGTGRDADLCLSLGIRYVGIDFSKPMLDVASERHSGKSEGLVMLACMNMQHLGFRDESFDGFRSVTSFMHVQRHKLAAVLSGLRRVLKPGAIGALSLPGGSYYGMHANGRNGLRAFVACWQPHHLDRVIRESGFRIVLARQDHHILIRNVQKV